MISLYMLTLWLMTLRVCVEVLTEIFLVFGHFAVQLTDSSKFQEIFDIWLVQGRVPAGPFGSC